MNYENQEVFNSEASKTYLLAIGINDYNYENWPILNMPVKDVRDVVSLLIEKYNITHVDTFFNDSASYLNIRNKIAYLKEISKPQDAIIIYFAGHGEYDESFDKEGKWILSNGRLDNNSLAVAIEDIPARHILVLADACFSGSFYLKRGKDKESSKVRNERKSRWVLASGSMESVLDQMPGKKNSPFAYHLIEFLKRAKVDVPFSELRDYLETEVPKYTNQKPVAGPVRGDEGGEFIFKKKKR